MSCDPEASACVLSQTAMADDKTWLGTVQLIVNSAGPDPIPILFVVPEGVHLASGLFYADGATNPKQAEWLRCAQGSCVARGALDAEAQKAWQRGTTAEMRYRPRQDAPAIAVKMSLLGITAALQAAKEALQ